MDTKKQTLLEQYVDISNQLKELEKNKKEISEKLLNHMKEQKIGSIKAEFGTLTKAQKLVYTYSSEFKEWETNLKTEIKEAKQKEEQTQTPKVTEYLTFRAK